MALVALVQPEVPWFGFVQGGGPEHTRLDLLVAIWFAVFSLPMFPLGQRRQDPRSAARGKILQVRQPDSSEIGPFDRSASTGRSSAFCWLDLLYNDGLVTIFQFAAIYAGVVFGFDFKELLVFGIVINVMSGLGAFGLGFSGRLPGWQADDPDLPRGLSCMAAIDRGCRTESSLVVGCRNPGRGSLPVPISRPVDP